MSGVRLGLMMIAGLVLLAGPARGYEGEKKVISVAPAQTNESYALRESPGSGLYASASVDTYTIVYYDFETLSWQGWTRVDNTEQKGIFWHVDDFAGLDGGAHGGLTPLEGTKSMWCGARPSQGGSYSCSWSRAPGYGNLWAQTLGTNSDCDSGPPLPRYGPITLSYKIAYDVEPNYDFVTVEYDAHCNDWQVLARYTGRGSVVAEHHIPGNFTRTKLRFRFTSDGTWSDEDGLLDTDGACIVDSLCVSDPVEMLSYENFEGSAVGATGAGIWWGLPGSAFGRYSGLKTNLQDKDPCGENLSTQVVFFVGSPVPSLEYPGLFETPYLMGSCEAGMSQDEMIVSPVIDLKKYSTARNNVQNGSLPPDELPFLGATWLRFNVYRDLPSYPLVFYFWRVRSIENGCSGPWRDAGLYYSGSERQYIPFAQNVSDLITSDSIQVAVGIRDLCSLFTSWYWCEPCDDDHTPAPWFDDIRVERFKTSGPQWSYRDMDLFQDNFPNAEYDIESYVRADAALDINPLSNPVIRPGDSVVVGCTSPVGGGIASDPAGGPAIYMHVKCSYIGPSPLKPNLAGAILQGSCGTFRSDDGTWTIIQGDSARAAGRAAANTYMFDLNDALFTRGYMIEYYFSAMDNSATETALPRWARSGGPYFEFTCLPTKNSDILYVDDCSGIGSFAGAAEEYWGDFFRQNLMFQPDRYDVSDPASAVSNGPGSRAKNYQLTDQYQMIIWDSGELTSATISDGTVDSDKSNDCEMLIEWMDLSNHRCALWVCGDGIANDLNSRWAPQALGLMSTRCGVTLVNDGYFDLAGGLVGSGVVNPLITGDAEAGVFVHVGVPDMFYAMGGCPDINRFDVLEKTAGGQYALRYPSTGPTNRYAGISHATANSGGYDVRTMWFGFSYMSIGDDGKSGPIDRYHVACDFFHWTSNIGGPCDAALTAVENPLANRLAQNFPNPFNPLTTIHYDMKEKGLVRIKIYNVAGELVRTLVNDVKDAGAYSLPWDGRNNAGADVASGIYFYKMETKGFSATKKMVILK